MAKSSSFVSGLRYTQSHATKEIDKLIRENMNVISTKIGQDSQGNLAA